MNTSAIISGVLLVIILLGGMYLYSNQSSPSDTDGPTNAKSTLSTTTTPNQQNSMNQEPETNSQPTSGPTTVILKTNRGDITLELYTDQMPITAGNFVKLAKEEFYDNTKFHRVIDGFMIQGGDPNSKGNDTRTYGTGGPGYTIEDEFKPGFSNVRGTISMANTGATNSGGSQFFINLNDNTGLDYDKQPLSSRHPVFGRVIAGMEVVDAIAKVETGANDVPVEAVIITDVVIK